MWTKNEFFKRIEKPKKKISDKVYFQIIEILYKTTGKCVQVSDRESILNAVLIVSNQDETILEKIKELF